MASSDILDRLFEVIRSRRGSQASQSYVASLLAGGVAKTGAKVREESEELIEAAAGSDRQHSVHEAADLLFHVWVLLECAGVEPSAVYAELERRFGTSGHEEKRARTGAPREGEG